MRLLSTLVLAFGATLLPLVASAGVEDVSPALREQAEAVCREDAMRLCADAIPDETAIIACMRPKRKLLTISCRKIFDEVMQDVRR